LLFNTNGFHLPGFSWSKVEKNRCFYWKKF
jgi:hypothetical protein